MEQKKYRNLQCNLKTKKFNTNYHNNQDWTPPVNQKNRESKAAKYNNHNYNYNDENIGNNEEYIWIIIMENILIIK